MVSAPLAQRNLQTSLFVAGRCASVAGWGGFVAGLVALAAAVNLQSLLKLLLVSCPLFL